MAKPTKRGERVLTLLRKASTIASTKYSVSGRVKTQQYRRKVTLPKLKDR